MGLFDFLGGGPSSYLDAPVKPEDQNLTTSLLGAPSDQSGGSGPGKIYRVPAGYSDPEGYDMNGPGSPHLQSFENFAKAYRTDQVVNAFARSPYAGIASLLLGSSNDAVPAYNQMLSGAADSAVKGYTLPKAQAMAGLFNGSVDPASGAPYASGAPPSSAPLLAPTSAPPPTTGLLGGPTGAPPLPSGAAPPATGPAPAQMFLGHRLPAGVTTQQALHMYMFQPEVLGKMLEASDQADQNIRQAQPVAFGKAAGEGLMVVGPNGLELAPGAAASKSQMAGAVKGAEATAQNASDLRYKPAIEGGIAGAKQPFELESQGNKAWLDALQKWTIPTETRPGNDVVQFSGNGPPDRSAFMGRPGVAPPATGAPMQGGTIGSAHGPIPVAGQPSPAQAPVAPLSQTAGPTTLYSNNGETYETGKKLADETAASRVAADGAYTQRALYGKMLDALPNANLGSLAAERTAVKNFANTWIPGIDTSKSVTQDQVFDKLATQIAGQATKQLDQTAVAALETMRKAYPNREMTSQALREMVGQLSGLQDYIITKDQARQDFIGGQGHGTSMGFTQGAWMKDNPPEKFINAGILKTIPPAAQAALKQYPNKAADFDSYYGPGTSRLVLGTGR